MRGFLIGLLLSACMGITMSSLGVFFVSLGICWGFAWFLSSGANSTAQTNIGPWLSAVKDCDYKHGWDRTGIAIDKNKQQIHLTGFFKRTLVSKTYNFSDVRDWGYEMPGAEGRHLMPSSRGDLTAALATGAINIAGTTKALENTGFWVLVKDIDYPKWFIKFRCPKVQDKNTEMELIRWTEILNQSVEK